MGSQTPEINLQREQKPLIWSSLTIMCHLKKWRLSSIWERVKVRKRKRLWTQLARLRREEISSLQSRNEELKLQWNRRSSITEISCWSVLLTSYSNISRRAKRWESSHPKLLYYSESLILLQLNGQLNKPVDYSSQPPLSFTIWNGLVEIKKDLSQKMRFSSIYGKCSLKCAWL